MTRTLLAVALAVLVATSTASGRRSDGRQMSCPSLHLGSGHPARIERALRAKEDVWGHELLRARDGPTYAGARRYLQPLALAKGPGGVPLTRSGYHYVAFTQPSGPEGSGSAALHVADGSQIVSRRVGGPTLSIFVGPAGGELYGWCQSRLPPPRLASGYLPILQTRYVDSAGVRHVQESFAARPPGSQAIESFVWLTADARFAQDGTEIRFVSGDGHVSRYKLPAGQVLTAHVAYSSDASSSRIRVIDGPTYAAARESVVRYWRARLGEGPEIEVPEPRVEHAVRSLLLQNLGLGWRYSIGNPYQQFSYPEALDVAQVMAAYGFRDVAGAILRRSLATPRGPYPNWRLGQKLVAAALYYRLFADERLVADMTPDLRRGVSDLGRQLASSGERLLRRERYSSDIPDLVHGLHSQAVVRQGLLAMGRVWLRTGDSTLATRALALASRLEDGLHAAVRRSQRPLPDGSLFVPVRLRAGERPYGSVTESRAGSYWNLVLPYALASGLFEPNGRVAEGVLDYMLRHGSRMLGLVRAGAYSLYGRDAAYPTGGVNPVYGLNVARFLADNDQPDQLVLSLYGQLAAGMTPGTYVSGEAVSIAPLRGEGYRSTYLPPNAASNASFLETLRLLLVHEIRGHDVVPKGLELGFATPRGWLEAGKQIAVRGLPTSFGSLSFTMRSLDDRVHATLEIPGRVRLRSLRLRLRLPRGDRVGRVTYDGRPAPVLHGADTVDLPARPGRHVVVAAVLRADERRSD